MPSTETRTAQQLLRLLRHEHPLFVLKLLKNSIAWATHKYLARSTFVTKRIHSYYMTFDISDPGISRSLLLVGDREREHRYMLQNIIRPGMNVLDLGANIGYYVLMEHLLMRSAGHVVAVEPEPQNFEILQRNIKLNARQSRTTLINAAVADHDGYVSLYLSQLSNTHSLLKDNSDRQSGRTVQVPAVSLATLVRHHGPFDLIRMDIEGYEYEILHSLLKNQAESADLPAILFELHPTKYNQPKFRTLLQDLYAAGYEAALLACSHKDLLEQYNAVPIASIPTDGTVRHIVKDLSLDQLLHIYPRSRALLLTHSSASH